MFQSKGYCAGYRTPPYPSLHLVNAANSSISNIVQHTKSSLPFQDPFPKKSLGRRVERPAGMADDLANGVTAMIRPTLVPPKGRTRWTMLSLFFFGSPFSCGLVVVVMMMVTSPTNSCGCMHTRIRSAWVLGDREPVVRTPMTQDEAIARRLKGVV